MHDAGEVKHITTESKDIHGLNFLHASWRGAPASARDKFYQFLVRITSQNDPNFEDPWLTSCGHANPRRHLGNWRSPISVDGEVRNFKNDWDLSSKGMKAHKKLFRVSKSSICFLESCAMIISITPCHSLWRKHSAQSLPAMARCRSCQAPLEPRLNQGRIASPKIGAWKTCEHTTRKHHPQWNLSRKTTSLPQ